MPAIDTPWRKWKPGTYGPEYKRALHGHDLLVYRDRTTNDFWCHGGFRSRRCFRWVASIDGGPNADIPGIEFRTMRDAMAACEAEVQRLVFRSDGAEP